MVGFISKQQPVLCRLTERWFRKQGNAVHRAPNKNTECGQTAHFDAMETYNFGIGKIVTMEKAKSIGIKLLRRVYNASHTVSRRGMTLLNEHSLRNTHISRPTRLPKGVAVERDRLRWPHELLTSPFVLFFCLRSRYALQSAIRNSHRHADN